MLRAPSDRGKENPVRVRGCPCNANRARLHHATLPPLAPHALVPELFNSTVLRDVASQTNVCRSTQRQRSKSSNEGNIQRLGEFSLNVSKKKLTSGNDSDY